MGPDEIDVSTGFCGAVVSVRPYQIVEGAVGFRGANMSTNKNQYIEINTGFKGVSIALIWKGSAVKIKHK